MVKISFKKFCPGKVSKTPRGGGLKFASLGLKILTPLIILKGHILSHKLAATVKTPPKFKDQKMYPT